MRKIKSVKLAKEFNNGEGCAIIGTELVTYANNGFNYYSVTLNSGAKWYFSKEIIRENLTGLFTIEYELEGFEFKKFLEGFEFKKFNEDFPEIYFCSQLNRLADWCDRQSEKDKDEAILYFAIYANPKNELKISSFMFTINQGLKFNSQKSAKLFLSELNKPENSDYKNYFINLLKKTRL